MRVEDGKLVAERPILQDSQISDVSTTADVGVIIGRLNAFEASEGGSTAEIEDVEVEYAPYSLKATMVQRGEQRGADVNIEDDYLVAGGRGLGKAEGFEQLEELANALAAPSPPPAPWSTPAGSPTPPRSARRARPSRRSCTWRPASPARSSKVGMQSSENIVAINKDSTPRSSSSRLGIVGDLNKIVPKLTEAVKAKKAARCRSLPQPVPPAGRLGGEFVGPLGRGGRADRGRRRDRRRRPGRAPRAPSGCCSCSRTTRS